MHHGKRKVSVDETRAQKMYWHIIHVWKENKAVLHVVIYGNFQGSHKKGYSSLVENVIEFHSTKLQKLSTAATSFCKVDANVKEYDR